MFSVKSSRKVRKWDWGEKELNKGVMSGKVNQR